MLEDGVFIIDPTFCTECSAIVEGVTVADGVCESCWESGYDPEGQEEDPAFDEVEPWGDWMEYTFVRDHQLI